MAERLRYPYTALGALIKEARERAGLTQEQAAKAIGASRATWMNWERGEVRPTNFYDRIGRLFTDLDVEYLQLVGDVAAAREQAKEWAERMAELESRLERYQATRQPRRTQGARQ